VVRTRARHGLAGRRLEQGRGRRPQERPGDLQRDEGLEPVSRGREGVLSGFVDRHGGLWIERPHPAHPIVNSAIPLRELEINLGPRGEIDDRFVCATPATCMSASWSARTVWAKIGGAS
jgi:hypothetical protein